MTTITFGQVNYSGSFSYSDGGEFSLAVRYLYSKDFNGDGLDEVIFSGFETQPNTPTNYTNTKVSIFGWSNGSFIDLTSQWLPGDADLVQGVGDIAFGDFNGDGLIDTYLSGYADMNHQVHAYAYLNQGSYFTRQDLGLTEWEHGVASGDINQDGYDDVVAAGYIDPSVFYLGGAHGLSKQIVQEGYAFNSYETHASGVEIADFLGNGTTTLIVVDSATGNASDTRLLRTVAGSDSTILGFQHISTLPIPRLEQTQYGLNITGYDNSHDIRVRALDFTDDGLMDAIVFSRGGWDGSRWVELSQVQFLENLGNGQFADVTNSRLIGYEDTSNITYTPIIRDINLDGLVDVFLSESSWGDKHLSTSILIQQQDGTFVDTGREQISSYIAANNGIASLAQGPNHQIHLVIEVQSYGGNAIVSTVPISFPDRENAESLYGTRYAEAFYGLGGNDFIAGWGGNDTIDGGDGLDTAVYAGTISEYGGTVASRTIIDLVTNRDGTDTLINVERLQFTDTMLALDTRAYENAGNAYLLYQAAFDRTPDAAGLGYWIAQMDNGANAVRDMAMNFILSDEFISLYGPNPTVPEFMNLLYENVLNRPNDAAGLDYWLSEFARDGDTLMKRAATLNNFAISAENVTNVADQIDTGILYQAYVG